MEAALAWIGQIAAWIGQWIPRWVIIETTLGGVKFVHGKRIVPLGPGIHFWWPVTTELKMHPVVRQANDLRAQTVVTTDDKVIAVGGMIVYEIHDIEKILAHTFEPDNTIRDICLTAIHDVCCKRSWEELKAGQRKGTLDTALRNEAKKHLDTYGVTVLKLALTDMAPCRVLKVMQSTAKDGE